MQRWCGSSPCCSLRLTHLRHILSRNLGPGGIRRIAYRPRETKRQIAGAVQTRSGGRFRIFPSRSPDRRLGQTADDRVHSGGSGRQRRKAAERDLWSGIGPRTWWRMEGWLDLMLAGYATPRVRRLDETSTALLAAHLQSTVACCRSVELRSIRELNVNRPPGLARPGLVGRGRISTETRSRDVKKV